MSDRIQDQARIGQWINLFVPGGGLIVLQAPWTGWLLGLLFILCLNYALAATLIFPDDVPGRWRALSIAGAALVYVLSQLRFGQVVRLRAAHVARRRRDEALRLAREHLVADEYDLALEALRELRQEAPDLLVSVRIAQALTGLGETRAALEEWRVVESLDEHYLYRRERLEAERRLAATALRRNPSE